MIPLPGGYSTGVLSWPETGMMPSWWSNRKPRFKVNLLKGDQVSLDKPADYHLTVLSGEVLIMKHIGDRFR